jgi:hypothetical protein
MILPTKHISVQHSLLGAGAVVLRHLDHPQTITALWERIRSIPETSVYWRFILALDFLYAIGTIEHADGFIQRCKQC